jgi:hypothetical protein
MLLNTHTQDLEPGPERQTYLLLHRSPLSLKLWPETCAVPSYNLSPTHFHITVTPVKLEHKALLVTK